MKPGEIFMLIVHVVSAVVCAADGAIGTLLFVASSGIWCALAHQYERVIERLTGGKK